MKIANLEVYTFRAKVSQAVVTSFSTIPSRAMALIRIENTDGQFGWGEIWGNFPIFTTEHRAKLAGWALPQHLIGTEIDPDDIAGFCDGLRSKLHVLSVQSDEPGPVEGIIAATSQALWDLAARRAGLPLRHLLNPDAPNSVPAYASGLNPADCIETVARCRIEGYRAYKLKVGFDGDTDDTNLKALFADMEDGERLFVDANQRWNLEDAIAAAHRLAAYPIGWLEEPILADRPADEWRALKAECPLPLAGAENLRGVENISEALEWLDYVQPDVGKWGGVEGCMTVAQNALAAGRIYCPHWLAGGVGLMHSANLMAAAGGDGLLEIDSNENPLRSIITAMVPGIDNGIFSMNAEPGIGIDVPLEELTQWQTGHEVYR
ncbi:MAG: mandelate racemase/muconate lactonizing enzyme family protein [Rhodospirillaceae bacterium]|jgi:D-galactarolactone cycloisomerase|nr:mandelate racemase/muconate lactonizing enzyme family protein [Rhodospirillaceae bacterium]